MRYLCLLLMLTGCRGAFDPTPCEVALADMVPVAVFVADSAVTADTVWVGGCVNPGPRYLP